MSNTFESHAEIPWGSSQATLPEEPSGPAARLAFPLVFIAIAAIVAALFVGILKINDHNFVYTLDDPYIHLALSDQIRHGNYGLHAGSHAAPSSSILFPFILALASGTPLHPYFPLVINICALFFTLELMRRFLLHLQLGRSSFALVVQAFAVFLMALCFNLVGIVFTGLEHSLQVALVAATVYGLALFIKRNRLPAWLPIVLVLAPLVRYEGLALSFGAIVIIALRGRVRIALATFAVIVVLVGGFSVFLLKLGLAALPSSILVKSTVADGVTGAHGQFLAGAIRNVDFMIGSPAGLTLLVVGIIAAVRLLVDLYRRPRVVTPGGVMAFALFSLIAGHAVAGSFGWLLRYEDYVLLGSTLMAIYLAQAPIRSAFANRQDRLVLVCGAIACLLVVGAPYARNTALVPRASNNIYEQQFQMHAFVDNFYRDSVAVNDLGLVSYHNPNTVLDLGGLGSEPARLLIANHANAAQYQAFVASHDVHLVIIYQEWFTDQVPSTWQHVGTLSLSRSLVSAAYGEVQFYATDDATADKVRQELEAFRPSLPSRVELTID